MSTNLHARNPLNGHPDVPTLQSVCWRLQLPTCQLGLQQNIWRWEHGPLGNSQQPWAAVRPNASFLLSPMERRHQPGRGLRVASAGHNNRLPDRRVYQAHQQAAVRPMEGPNAWGKQYLWPFQARGACCHPPAPEARKSPGLDSIFPEFILPAVLTLKSWFSNFLTSCMRQLKIPGIWRRAPIVAIPKSEKPLGDPKSYRSISLLCVPLRILDRLILCRTNRRSLLPQKQTGFRHGRPTVDYVTLITQDIENSFSDKNELTAAYDTVWHRGLTCKLLRLLPDRHIAPHYYGDGWQTLLHLYHRKIWQIILTHLIGILISFTYY